MATQTSTGSVARTADVVDTKVSNGSSPAMLVVDLGKRQTRKKIKDLRKGRGKLVPRVEAIMHDLVASGAVSAGAQPVVIVVREEAPALWPFT